MLDLPSKNFAVWTLLSKKHRKLENFTPGWLILISSFRFLAARKSRPLSASRKAKTENFVPVDKSSEDIAKAIMEENRNIEISGVGKLCRKKICEFLANIICIRSFALT